MKKVSRIIALSLAILMISGVAVFASETITSVTPATQSVVADGDIAITAVAPTTVDQVTVVVYKGATADESSIAYIDQQPNTTGTVVFTFKMRDIFTTDSQFTVKVGGTNVDTADSSAVVNWTGAVTTYTISGTVTIQGTAPIAVTSTVGTATLTGSSVVNSTTVGTYSVTGIPANTDTTLTISAKGHATYSKTVSIATSDVVKNEVLLAGDADNVGSIGPSDLQLVYNNWYKASVEGNTAVDIDNDGSIGPSDLQLVYNNWYKTALGAYTN